MAKKKPCEFCESDQLSSEDGVNGHQLSVEFYPDNCLLAVTSFANSKSGESDELTFEKINEIKTEVLEEVSLAFGFDKDELIKRLAVFGFEYDPDSNRFW